MIRSVIIYLLNRFRGGKTGDAGLSFYACNKIERDGFSLSEKKRSTAERVQELVEPIAEQANVFLWDVRFEKEGASWFLKVIIDRDGGITFEDCEAVSRPLSKLLDEHDFIEQSYYLEVSSPGVMRQLKKPKHFEVCLGDKVMVRLIRPNDDGVREITGVLKKYENKHLTIETEQGDNEIAVSACAYIKLDDDIDFS